jgi:HKD family nuclease
VEARLLLQPTSEDERIGVALRDIPNNATAMWVLVAWAQQSGLDHVAAVAEQIQTRGGRAEAILGVDQGIATYEGLAAALDIFDDIYLFHDGARSFHPKVYVVESDAQTVAVVGSGNLTQGGLFTNFEAATVLTLDRQRLDDNATRERLRNYFEAFTGPGAPCRRLDLQLIMELRDAGAITTAAERTRTERQKRERTVPVLRRIFGDGMEGFPRAPRVPRRRTQPPAPPVQPPAQPAAPPTQAAPVVVASWWKKLTISDAMRKPPPSHQRNYVILGKARHPIDQKTFFKRHFFAGVNWAQQPMRTGRVKELAVVPFEVTLEGAPLGKFGFRIDHNEERIANQNNSPTWLNWSSFTDQVRRHNLTDRYLLLERLSDGTFRMSITRSEPGPAVIPAAASV